MIRINHGKVFMQGAATVVLSEIAMAMSEVIEAFEGGGIDREDIIKVLHKNVELAAKAVDKERQRQAETKPDESDTFGEEELKRIFKEAVEEMVGR